MSRPRLREVERRDIFSARGDNGDLSDQKSPGCSPVASWVNSIRRSSLPLDRLFFLPLAGAQDRETDDFLSLVANDDIVIGQLAIRGVARLFEINVKRVGFLVIRRLEIALRRSPYRRDQFQVILYVGYGHRCSLLFSD